MLSKVIRVLIGGACAWALSAGTAAPGPAPDSAALAAQILDSVSVEQFLDSVLALRLEAQYVPGAAIAVVQNGSIVLLKGYGLADVLQGRFVNPESTLFPVMSVTKLLTATAVMQLIERGLSSLDTDVTPYLAEVGMAKSFPGPVTVRQLLTHTSGFDNSDIGDATTDASAILRPVQFLRSRGIAQVFPPGTLWHYSNFNFVLLGHLIGSLSGQSYENYVRDQILTPLRMTRSTFDQPLPDSVGRNAAVGYEYDDDSLMVVKPDYSNVVPAGGLITTVEDMTRFMIAHLEPSGELARAILPEDALNEMHRTHFRYQPMLVGHALGFKEDLCGSSRYSYGDLRALTHDGARDGFRSELMLFPELRLGVFVVTNSRTGLPYELTNAFVSRFLLGHNPATPVPIDGPRELSQIEGWYKSVWHFHSTLEKFGGFISGRLYTWLRATPDGRLMARDSTRYVEVSPGLFQSEEGTQYFAVGEIAGDRYVHFGYQSYRRLEWYETRDFHWAVWRGFLVVLLTGAVGWPAAGLIRRLRKYGVPDKVGALRARRLGWLICALAVLFVAGLYTTSRLLRGGPLFDYGVPLPILLLLVLPIVVAIMWPLVAFHTYRAWRRRYWGVYGRLHYTAVLLAALAFLWWAYSWNLLGFRI